MNFEKMEVLDVCKWFVNKHDDIKYKSFNGNVKLQKLLYYTQVMALSVSGEPLFDNKIEAWKHGAVVSEAYRYYEHDFEEIKSRESARIGSDNEYLLNVVNSLYGFKTAKELEDINHEESPWLELKGKVDLRLNPVITNERIINYYTRMSELYHGFKGHDFDNETAEYIDNNVFMYNAKETILTAEDKMALYELSANINDESFYVYKENGELVVY